MSCLGPWPEAQTAGGRRVPDGPDPPRLTPCRSVGECGGMRVRVRGMALGLCAISPRWSGGAWTCDGGSAAKSQKNGLGASERHAGDGPGART